MSFRYNPLDKLLRRAYRKIDPVPRSPWTAGHVEDICAVNLVPPEKLVSFFGGCIERLRASKGEQIGDYLEFGVFNGNSLGSAYLAAKAASQPMRFFGFDAFEGLPPGAEHEDDGVWKKGFYACTFAQMSECLQKRNIDWKKLMFVKGWYDKTLVPATVRQHKLDNVGIVFVDCDTYSSAKSVLAFLGPLLTREAIICFDDWRLNDLDLKGMGEYAAFNEFLEQNPQFAAERIPSYNRKSETFVLRPKK